MSASQDFLNPAIHGVSSFYRIFDAISSPLSSHYSGRESRSDKILIAEGLGGCFKRASLVLRDYNLFGVH